MQSKSVQGEVMSGQVHPIGFNYPSSHRSLTENRPLKTKSRFL